MALPTNKTEFIEYCLRQLGKPVIQINLSSEQISDAYDKAILAFNELHMDGSQQTFYPVEITADLIADRQVALPSSILSVTEIITIPSSFFKDIVFDASYHLTSEIIWNMMRGGGMGMFDLAQLRQTLRETQFQTVGEVSYNFSRHTHLLNVYVRKERLNLGDFMMLDVKNAIDPETYPGVFKNNWLIEYTTALLKKTWASNLQKFSGIQLPGGVTMNGDALYQQAEATIEKMERELEDKWNLPLGFAVG